MNAKSSGGLTPLHYAAGKGRNQVAELLIAKSADVNAKDEEGKTPLDLAITSSAFLIADLLLKHGGKTKKELEAEGK